MSGGTKSPKDKNLTTRKTVIYFLRLILLSLQRGSTYVVRRTFNFCTWCWRTPYSQQQAATLGPPDTTVNTKLTRRFNYQLHTDMAVGLHREIARLVQRTGLCAFWPTRCGEWMASSHGGGIIACSWGVNFRTSWDFKWNGGWKLCWRTVQTNRFLILSLCQGLAKLLVIKMKCKRLWWHWDWEGYQEYFCGTIADHLLVHRWRFLMFVDCSSILAGTRMLLTSLRSSLTWLLCNAEWMRVVSMRHTLMRPFFVSDRTSARELSMWTVGCWSRVWWKRRNVSCGTWH